MSWIAFLLIITSAALHASWNIIAKKNQMDPAFYALICTTSMLTWLHVQFWTPVKYFDLPWQFWMFLAASIASDVLYCFTLARAYRKLEMSVAYPMMRSLPILFTVLLTALLGWGAELSVICVLGFVLVFTGCLLMPMKKFSNLSILNYLNKNFLTVILVALGTTGYTLFDSQAIAVLRTYCENIAKPTASLSYYSIRGITLTSTCWMICLLTQTNRQALINYIRQRFMAPVYAGFFASLAYALVLISMNYVTNVSYVQVFRQIGMLFGVGAGIIILKERFTYTKIAGVLLIVGGLIMTVL